MAALRNSFMCVLLSGGDLVGAYALNLIIDEGSKKKVPAKTGFILDGRHLFFFLSFFLLGWCWHFMRKPKV